MEKSLYFDENIVWGDFLNSDHGKAAETIRRYGSIYRNHVKAAFGNRIISSIPIGDISDFLKAKYSQDNYFVGHNPFYSLKEKP